MARPFPEPSDREREVLDPVAAGLPDAAVARRLSLSEETVRDHVSAVSATLGVRDRAEAVVRVREVGVGRS